MMFATIYKMYTEAKKQDETVVLSCFMTAVPTPQYPLRKLPESRLFRQPPLMSDGNDVDANELVYVLLTLRCPCGLYLGHVANFYVM